MIRSCFGGLQQNFVVSGSEGGIWGARKGNHKRVVSCVLFFHKKDSSIYVWNRNGALLERLAGHTACVNSVAWNRQRNLIASASDDRTVRVWRSAPLVGGAKVERADQDDAEDSDAGVAVKRVRTDA